MGADVCAGTGLSRSLPADWGELAQVHDDRETVQMSPDELPASDIRSL